MADDPSWGDPVPGSGINLGIAGYEDATVIGKGGFAVVYRARQTAFNRFVAVKVLSRVRLDERALQRFERERAAMGALSTHPNIVTIYDSGLTLTGTPFLAMEYLPLGSLAERLRGSPPLDWRRATDLAVKLAGALETAHRAGVLHRDVKPENVLLSGFREPQLADFGIARVVGDYETDSVETNLSVPHAPPEVIEGQRPSSRSDVYSLASTLFALVYGRPAFVRNSDESLIPVLARITSEPPPDLRAENLPDRFCRILERAMAKNPDDRHASALEFGEDLQLAQVAVGLAPTSLPLEDLATGQQPMVPEVLTAGPRQVEIRSSWRGSVPDYTTPLTLPGDPPRMPPIDQPDPAARLSPAVVPRASRRRGLAGVTAVVAVLLVAGIFTAVALQSDAPVTPQPGRPPSGTTPPTMASSTPASSLEGPQAPPVGPSGPRPLPSGRDPIPAGSYLTPGFLPVMAFNLEAGWRRQKDELNDVFTLERTSRPGALMTFLRAERVVDPEPDFSSIAESRKLGAAEPAPGDLVKWIHDHPRLAADPPELFELGAVSGRRVDATVESGYPACKGAPSCVVLFRLSGETVFLVLEGYRNRLYVFDLQDTQVVAIVEAPADQFDGFVLEVEALLATLTFPPS